jgi:N-acylneuraminate cytidylyltransferase
LSSICIIPARGGSKRIPGKNIRSFLGKPIIAYSIEAALKSELFDVVMVSTDDQEIADIAVKYGASVPFLRSSDNSGDMATTYQVVEEVIGCYASEGRVFDYTCTLYATAPFVTADKLKMAYSRMSSTNSEAIYTVQEFSYPIQRSVSFQEDGLKLNWPENFNKRSQDLTKNFHDCGQFYLYETDVYLEKVGVFNMNSDAIIISEMESQDIDSETDWQLAELKYQLMLKN